MKDDVLRILQNALALAKDNRHRANMGFGHLNADEMKEPQGCSGVSRAEILAGYRAECDRLEKCVDWVKQAS